MSLVDDTDSTTIDTDVQSEVLSILSKWSENVIVEGSKDYVSQSNDMKGPIQTMVRDNIPEKEQYVPPLERKRFADGRIWKSAIPPNNPVNSSPSPNKKKRRRKRILKGGKNTSDPKIVSSPNTSFSRTLLSKPRYSRPPVLLRRSVKKKKKKKPNFLVTSTSFHKKTMSPEKDSPNKATRPKRKRKKKKKLSKRIKNPIRSNGNLSQYRVSRTYVPRTQRDPVQYNNSRKTPNMSNDFSLSKSLQKRVNFLKHQLEKEMGSAGEPVLTRGNPSIVPQLPPAPSIIETHELEEPGAGESANLLPVSEHIPSIIGDGDKDYVKEQERQKELEKELARLRNELHKQKQEKITVANELKAMEIEKEKKKLESVKKEQVLREAKAIEEVKLYRNTRLMFRYFKKWRSKYKLKISRDADVLRKSREFRVKIGVIFEWKLKRRMFRKFRTIVSLIREKRERKKMRERLRKDETKIRMIQRERRIKVLTKTFQKWRFKAKMKAAERGFQKEREVLAKQRSKFLSRFRSKLGGGEERADDVALPPAPDTSPVLITNFVEEEKKEEKVVGEEEGEGDELFEQVFEGHKVKRVRNLKSETTGEEDTPNENSPKTTKSPSRKKKRKKKMGKNRSSGKLKRPLFVKTMEERRKQREEKWVKLKKKYREQDLERMKKEQEGKLLKEEEERLKKKEMREKKKRLEQKKKLRIAERKKRKENFKKKVEMADDLRKRLLKKYYGWIPFRKFFDARKVMYYEAESYHEIKLKRNVFSEWRGYIKALKQVKKREDERKIEVFLGVVELRRKKWAIRAWRKKLETSQEILKKYDVNYRESVKRKYLRRWGEKLMERRKERVRFLESVEGEVQKLSRKVTLNYYLKKFLKHMEGVREEKEKDELGKELKTKVDSWISEFRFKRNFNWDEL